MKPKKAPVHGFPPAAGGEKTSKSPASPGGRGTKSVVPKYNAFLTYWPWLLPIGVVIAVAGLLVGRAGILTDYWAGFSLGMGAFLALMGLGMLLARIHRSRKP